jgi:hypothetical protein
MFFFRNIPFISSVVLCVKPFKMPSSTRSIGLAFLLSLLLVAGVALTSRSLLLVSTEPATACQQHYTVACLF